MTWRGTRGSLTPPVMISENFNLMEGDTRFPYTSCNDIWKIQSHGVFFFFFIVSYFYCKGTHRSQSPCVVHFAFSWALLFLNTIFTSQHFSHSAILGAQEADGFISTCWYNWLLLIPRHYNLIYFKLSKMACLILWYSRLLPGSFKWTWSLLYIGIRLDMKRLSLQ